MSNRKKQLKSLLGKLRRADEDYSLINEGDKIAVGVSGGKDSLLLLEALSIYQKFNLKKFELIAITVDASNGEIDYSEITSFCENLNIEYIIEPSNIFKVIFEIRKEPNPCSLCSKLRRGVLNTVAKQHNCNKVALGHHADDLIETFLLSFCYEGRLNTFKPRSFLSRMNLTLIRPLIYATEHEVRALSKNLPVITNPCPVNHKTKREYMKNLVSSIAHDIPTARESMLLAITKTDRYNLLDKD